MLKTFVSSFVEDFIRNISGPIGIRLRRYYYSRQLKSCGDALTIEPGVAFLAPEHISVGDNVWIDRNVILVAGAVSAPTEFIRRLKVSSEITEAEIIIGDNAHIGIGTIIQGHGGVKIGDNFTASSHVKIYSYSNNPRLCTAGTLKHKSYNPHYVLSPVHIENNVWLGLDVTLIGHHIQENSFAKPGSVILSNFPANSVLSGNPAKVTAQRVL